jgi:hypothetical protein
MTPAEFDAACRELRRRCPYLSETSGARTKARNLAAEGLPRSKHVIGMARDFGADGNADERHARLIEASLVARELGLWALVHDVGNGDHLHVQGLPVGAVPAEWAALHLNERGFA